MRDRALRAALRRACRAAVRLPGLPDRRPGAGRGRPGRHLRAGPARAEARSTPAREARRPGSTRSRSTCSATAYAAARRRAGRSSVMRPARARSPMPGAVEDRDALAAGPEGPERRGAGGDRACASGPDLTVPEIAKLNRRPAHDGRGPGLPGAAQAARRAVLSRSRAQRAARRTAPSAAGSSCRPTATSSRRTGSRSSPSRASGSGTSRRSASDRSSPA